MTIKNTRKSVTKPKRKSRSLAMGTCSASDFIAWLNSPASREKHRSKYNDIEWAGRQPKGAPKCRVGDVVEFHVGGFGVIDKVSEPQGGWPSSYATYDIAGMAPHKTRKSAWHYEGDFCRWAAKSPLHSLHNDQADPRPAKGDSGLVRNP